MKISVIGQGFVGLSLSTVLASNGIEVFAIENNSDKLSQLVNGQTPFFEPKLDSYLKNSLKKKKLHFQDSLETVFDKISIIFITVSTPTKNGKINLNYIKKVFAELIPLIDKSSNNVTIVIKSTIAPGTTQKFILPLIKKSTKKIGKDIFLAINPEFLREGFAIEDQLNPHVVVVGCEDKITKNTMKIFYEKIYKKNIPIIFTNFSTAELIKYSNNAFLATKISFINSISNLCQTIPGSNIDDIAKVIGMDPRIGSQFLNAGPGFGGSCLPKDLLSLISVLKDHNVDSSLFKSVKLVNDTQTNLIFELLKNKLKILNNKNISILGLSFKENSDDIRESKSIFLIQKILNSKSRITVFDPLAINNTKKIFDNKIKYAKKISECYSDSDAVIIMNSNKEFSKISNSNIKKMRYPLIIDTRRVMKNVPSTIDYIALGVNS